MTTRAGRGRLSEVLWPAVSGGLFFGPTLEAFDVLLFGEVWSWSGVVVRSSFFAVGMAGFAAIAPRFSATSREQAAVASVVSMGDLPADTDGEWRGRLVGERRRVRSARTSVQGLSGLAAVLVAVVTLLPDGPGGWGWLLATGLVLAGALLAVREHRRLRTVERLLAELEEGPASWGESAHVGERPPSA